MRPKRFWPLNTVISLELEPAGSEEEMAIRALRARLAQALGFSHPDPDAYTFHITLAYFFKRPGDAGLVQLEGILAEELQGMAGAVPSFVIGPPEFCHFNDMFAFSRRFFLQ